MDTYLQIYEFTFKVEHLSNPIIPIFDAQLQLVNDEIRFQLIPVLGENVTVTTAVKFPPYNTSWHAVELNYTKGEISVLVDYRNKQSKLFSMTFELGDKVIIGSGKNNTGKFLSKFSHNNATIIYIYIFEYQVWSGVCARYG